MVVELRRETLVLPHEGKGDVILESVVIPSQRHLSLPQSSSASITAGAAAFFILSQSGERPELYIESLRFDTMPSSPILQALLTTSPGKRGTNRGREAFFRRVEGTKVEARDNVARSYLFCNDIAFRGARIRGLVPFFSRAALSTQLGRC